VDDPPSFTFKTGSAPAALGTAGEGGAAAAPLPFGFNDPFPV
jgi:hypothetical protein